MYAYLDDDNNIVRCGLQEFVRTGRKMSHHIARDEIGWFYISTVFLGIESFGGWFETMVFDRVSHRAARSELEKYQERFYTYKEAIENHRKLCRMAHASLRLLPAPEGL